MRKDMRTNINEIRKMTTKFPKTLKEALNFNETDDSIETAEEPTMEPEIHHEEPVMDKPNEPKEMQSVGMNVAEFVDDIRKKALRGMAELADNPDDEKYQLLKKIWAICDKKPEQQSTFNTQNIREQ